MNNFREDLEHIKYLKTKQSYKNKLYCNVSENIYFIDGY